MRHIQNHAGRAGPRLALAVCGAAVALAACDSGSGAIGTSQTSKGTLLAGPSGNTVYVLLSAQGTSVPCSGSCAAVWPPLTASGTPQAGAGVTASLGTTSKAGTSMQVTANGMPVYYYSGDSGSGQANGQGINSFGGIWYAVQPNGQPMMTSSGGGGSPSSSAPGSAGPSYGGY